MSQLQAIAMQLKDKEEPLYQQYKELTGVAVSETEKKVSRYLEAYQRLQLDCLRLLLGKVPERFQSFGVVTGDAVNLRTGPGGRHTLVRELARGTRVVIKEQDGFWFSVQLTDGTEGYIFQDYIKKDEI